jgi:hypothetical protein
MDGFGCLLARMHPSIIPSSRRVHSIALCICHLSDSRFSDLPTLRWIVICQTS